MSDTKYGHLLEDHDWTSDTDENDTEASEPLVEVDYHTISIDDHRDAHGYEYGLQWTFTIQDGRVEYLGRAHYLEGRTQADPMSVPPWEAVPGLVKQQLARELNVDDLDQHVNPDLFEDGDFHE